MRADLIKSSPELRKLARDVEAATEGDVTFAYATQPSQTVYYVFDVHSRAYDPKHDRMTKSEAVTWLSTVLAAARRSGE